MDNRFKETTMYEIDYEDFDAFVEEKLGREYECVADNEWNNYSSYDFDVEKPKAIDILNPESFFMKYTAKEVEQWIHGEKSTIDTDSLLEYMVWQNILPEGKYLIKVFW